MFHRLVLLPRPSFLAVPWYFARRLMAFTVPGTKKKTQSKSQGLQEGQAYLVPHGAMQATAGPSKVGSKSLFRTVSRRFS